MALDVRETSRIDVQREKSVLQKEGSGEVRSVSLPFITRTYLTLPISMHPATLVMHTRVFNSLTDIGWRECGRCRNFWGRDYKPL